MSLVAWCSTRSERKKTTCPAWRSIRGRVVDEAETDARVAEVEDALAVAVAAAASSPVPIMSSPPVAPQSAEKIDGGQMRGHFSRTCVFCPF